MGMILESKDFLKGLFKEKYSDFLNICPLENFSGKV